MAGWHWVLLIGGLVAFATPCVAIGQTGQGACLVGNSLRDAGFLEEATAAYVEVLGNEALEPAEVSHSAMLARSR